MARSDKRSTSLFAPKVKFDSVSWQAMSDEDKQYIFFRFMEKNIVEFSSFLKGFLSYNKEQVLLPDKLVEANKDVDIFFKALDELRGVYTDERDRRALVMQLLHITTDVSSDELHESFASRLWSMPPYPRTQQDFWYGLQTTMEDSARKEKQPRIERQIKNVLQINADKPLDGLHPLSWDNPYVFETVITSDEERKAMWKKAVADGNPVAISAIILGYEKKDPLPENHPVFWEVEGCDNIAEELFLIVASYERALPSVVKFLWQRLSKQEQQQFLTQSLTHICKPSVAVDSSDESDASNSDSDEESVERVDEDVVDNVLKCGLTPQLWEDMDPVTKRELWFSALQKDKTNLVKTIVRFYEGQPLDDNHPLRWLDERGHSAPFVLLHQANLGGSAINNVLFNFLFNKGADPLHGRMPDFAALPMRFNNAKAVVGHYQTLLYCKHVHARFADVPELSLASNRQIFMHNMESGFRSACSFASDVYRRPGFAPANYFQHVNLTFADAWKKICRYVFNGAKPLESVPLDPPCLRRLAEICMGEYVDAKGMSCSFIGSKALTPIERSVVDIVLTGTNLAPGQQLVIDPTLRVNSWINAFTKNMIASVELRARKAEAMRNSVMAQPSQSSRAAEEVLLPALPPYVPKTSSSREVSAPVAAVTSPADSSTALQTQQSDQTTQQIA